MLYHPKWCMKCKAENGWYLYLIFRTLQYFSNLAQHMFSLDNIYNDFKANVSNTGGFR